MADLGITTELMTEAQAETVATKKPVSGNVKVHIRMRQSEMAEEMVNELESQDLFSHFKKGKNVNGVYHWKVDRWHLDYYLFAIN